MDVFALTMRLKAEGTATVNAALGTMRRGMKDTAKDANTLSKATDGISGSLKTLAASLAATMGARELANIADGWTNITAQLSMVSKTAEELAGVQSTLFDLAQKTKTAYEDVGTLYLRVAGASKSLGLSQQQIFDITTKVAQATALSGASTQEAAASIIQLGQAFNNGMVQAQEWTSIAENTPRLAMAIADAFNMTTADFGKAVREQKVASSDLARAILADTKLAAEAAKSPTTISGALVPLRNTIGQFVNEINKATGASAVIVNAINWIGQNLPTITALIVTATAAWVSYRTVLLGVTAAQTAMALATAIASANLAKVFAGVTAGGAAVALFLKISSELEKAVAKIGGEAKTATQAVAQETLTLSGGLIAAKNKAASYIEMLAELAGITTITTSQHKALTTEATRLSVALTASNLSMARRLELSKQLQAVESALSEARIRFSFEEDAAKLKASAGTFGAAGPTALGVSPAAIDPAEVAARVKAGITPAFDAARAIFQQELVALGKDMDKELTNVIGNALVSGIENAIATGSIGEGFKSMAAALLSGLGDIVQRLGMAMLPVATLMQRLMESMASLNPYAMAAAAVGLIALGASMKGIAKRAVSGAGSGSMAVGGTIGGLGLSGGGSTISTRQFGATMAGTASQSVAPVQPMNVTIIGPNDPNAQRQIAALMDNASRRGLVQGSQLRTV